MIVRGLKSTESPREHETVLKPPMNCFVNLDLKKSRDPAGAG